MKVKEDSEKACLKLNIQESKITVPGPIIPWQIDGSQWQTVYSWAPKSLQIMTAAMKLKDASPGKKSYDQTKQHIKKQRHYFANISLSSQGYGFPSSHVWMWELYYKGSWELQNRYFWNMVLEMTLESPLDCKESWPVHPKGNQFWISKGDQSWIFIGRTDAEAETLILWPPHEKC